MLLFFTLRSPMTFVDTLQPLKILCNSNLNPIFRNKSLLVHNLKILKDPTVLNMA